MYKLKKKKKNKSGVNEIYGIHLAKVHLVTSVWSAIYGFSVPYISQSSGYFGFAKLMLFFLKKIL